MLRNIFLDVVIEHVPISVVWLLKIEHRKAYQTKIKMINKFISEQLILHTAEFSGFVPMDCILVIRFGLRIQTLYTVKRSCNSTSKLEKLFFFFALILYLILRSFRIFELYK